jgi:hypothetical protein
MTLSIQHHSTLMAVKLPSEEDVLAGDEEAALVYLNF